MSNTGRTALYFVAGLGVGAGLALLFAPKSGKETREWMKETAEDGLKRVKKQGRESIEYLTDMVDSGEKKVAGALKTGRGVLHSVAEKLG